MASLLPMVKARFDDANGRPLAGGKVWFYIAGTSTPTPSYTSQSGLVANTNPVVLDANGKADIWLRPGSYKVVVMDADDVVIEETDRVAPADGGGGGLLDADYAFVGYSARFSEAFDTSGLYETIAQILDISYLAPQVSLSASGSGTVREKGTSVVATTLTAAITKRSDQISEVRFYQGATLLEIQSSGGGIPSGGNSVYSDAITTFTDNQTFSVQVDDTGLTNDPPGTPSTVTASASFTFVYPYYFGSGAAGLTAAQVAALTKDVRVSTSSLTKTFTPSSGEKFYFAYPASYGALTSILDENGFETFADWTLRTENITGLDATAQSYRIYEFNNTVVAGSYDFTFIR
jgi:hypothetical protein